METTGEWREGTRPEMGVVRSSFGQCASHPDVPDDGEPQQGADEAKHRTAMVLSCVAGVPCADMCHMGLRIDQCPSQLRDSWGGAGATELSMDSGCNSERKEDTHRESDNEPHYHSVPAPGQVLPGRGFRDHSHQTICARLLKRALQAWEQEVRRSPVEGMSRMLTCDGWIDDVVCPA